MGEWGRRNSSKERQGASLGKGRFRVQPVPQAGGDGWGAPLPPFPREHKQPWQRRRTDCLLASGFFESFQSLFVSQVRWETQEIPSVVSSSEEQSGWQALQ